MADEREDGVVIDHPNRDKAGSKATKAIVILLLLVSAALVAVQTIGGWEAQGGAQSLSLAYVALYVLIAFFVARWNRGVLPVVAALAMVLLIFAAVSAPAWFDRDQTGFTDPALSAGLVGSITLIIIPVQLLLIAFAMRGFQQAWNVEVERHPDGPPRAGAGQPKTA